jgi:ketosteroid isomerase-like protein
MAPSASLLLRFVACINNSDASGLAALMTDDHRFIDAAGALHAGREQMTAGWKQYFQMFPDYQIEIEATVGEGDSAAGFGWASGSFHGEPGKRWKFPAAFRLIVRDGLVAEWRVYADIEPMLQSMGVRRF